MSIEMAPIGIVHTKAGKIPRHFTLSSVEGTLEIFKKYLTGLRDIKAGSKIIVIFHFHKSPAFTPDFLIQKPKHRNRKLGVFSICSPLRPNAIGMSILNVIRINENIIHVKGLDMLDGTPILDIKPHVVNKKSCPSWVKAKK